MFCPNCGQPIDDSSRFCTYCAFPVGAQPESEPEQAEAVAEAAAEQPQAEPAPEAPEVEPVAEAPEAEPAPEAPEAKPLPEQAAEPLPEAQPVAPQQPQAEQAPQQPAYAAPVAPQPGYPQQPQYQTAAAYQQVPGAPQAPYAQAGVPAPAEKTSVTSQTWFKVVVGLVIALILFAIGKAVFDNTVGTIINAVSTVVVTDREGNPTADALINLDGDKLTDALDTLGWEFYDDERLWESEDGYDVLFAFGEGDYEFTEDDFESMDPCGGDETCIMTILVDSRDYDSLEDVADTLCQGRTQDQIEDEEYEIIYKIMESESGERYLVMISYAGYLGLYRVDIANPASISSGYAQEFLFLEGDTLDEIWQNLAGRDIAKG